MRSLLQGFILATLAMGYSASAAPGDLDLSFGNGGKVTTDFGTSNDTGRSVVLQSDGKIVVAGLSENGGGHDFALARYNADGSLDSDFGPGGKVITAIGSSDDYGNSVAVQADGKILVAGWATIIFDEVALVRYNADGSLDTGFGSGGMAITSFGSHPQGWSIALYDDGRIIIAGAALWGSGGSNYNFALARYNANGMLDTSFSGNGKVTTDFGSNYYDFGRSVALQDDGKIIVAGEAFISRGRGLDFALVRYNADGTLDSGFGSGGKVATAIGIGDDHGNSVAVQADGKIVVAGYSLNGSNWDVALVRYNADGTLDSGFGSGGKVISAIGSGYDNGYSVAVQADGKILVAGESYNNSGDLDFALVRYNADGSLDSGFGSGGKVISAIGSGDDRGYSVAVQADGKILVAGESYNNSGDLDFALVRYEGGPFSPLESWRLQHFNTVNNTGSAADTFDFDGDGLANLAEFGLGLIPTSGVSCQLPPAQRMGNDFVTIFNTPAGVSGITYGAEWSTTLAPNSWTPIPNTGTAPQNVFSVPIGGNAQMFMRLKLTSP